MKITHIALGGCLTAAPVRYGITEDTGGHIAYVLGAATAQAARADVASVAIVTRGFDDALLGVDHGRSFQPVQSKLCIRRLQTANRLYLAKEALAAELPALQEAFLKMLRDDAARPDIIHAHFADAAMLAAAAKAAYGIPFLYTPHSLGIDKAAHLNGAAGPRLSARIAQESDALSDAAAIVVSSRDEAERQIAAYGLDVEGRVRRVWPGVDLPSPNPSPRPALKLLSNLTDPDRPMILAIARPVLRKNLEILARAYTASPALQDRANLVILAGQHGPDVRETEETAQVWSGLQSTLAGPELAGRVALPSSHQPEDVGALYAAARATGGVFVNVALHEPFGLTLLEAASHGLPVLAGDRGGPPDIIAQMGHGQLVDPVDTDAVTAALQDMLDDRAAWDSYAQAARRNLSQFDWSTWAEGVARICKDIIHRARPRPRPAYVLGCDIDHTLTGSASALQDFAGWHRTRTGLFAVATGRSIVEARRVLGEWDVPLPDVFVTAVGTEVHRRNAQGEWVLDQGYAARLDDGWNRDAVRDCIRATGIEPQAQIEQRRWKFGCFGTGADANRLRFALKRAGLPAKVIASHDGLIDVIAAHGGKGAALSHVARCHGMTPANVIAVGDSGNDADMLTCCGRAILVGNALPEVAHLASLPHLYHARASYAAGIMEGLAHFGLLAPPNGDLTDSFSGQNSHLRPLQVAS